MLTWIREKFGSVVIGGIISVIALVFVFYGVVNPRSTRGLHEGAVAGTVNGDSISLTDFNREYNRRVEFFKNLSGGKFSEEQLKAFRIREAVFQELVRRKIMLQQAQHEGLLPSDEEVRDKVQEIAAFQKDGKFDLATYRQVLEANNYSTGSFEKMVREDLSQQRWDDYFKSRVQVSTDEVTDQFNSTEDKRNVKFVLFTTDVGKKGVKVDPAGVQKFLADPAKLNLAKNNFEQNKDKEFKGKSFDQVKEGIARDLVASEKTPEVLKFNEALADKVLPLLAAGKGNDAKINAMLKPYGAEVKSTGMVNRQSTYLPGIGEAPDLIKDLFAKQSPIDPADGGKAKKYNSIAWTLVAVVSESQKPDIATLAAKKDDLIRSLAQRKQRALLEAWMKKELSKAKVDANPSVIGGESS